MCWGVLAKLAVTIDTSIPRADNGTERGDPATGQVVEKTALYVSGIESPGSSAIGLPQFVHLMV